MNDFTKEELITLLLWGLDRIEIVGINNFTEEGHMDLFHRLQGIVVNYCEHKETEMDCDGGISLVCKSCGTTTMDVM